MSAEDRFVFVPYAEDPLEKVTELLLSRHRGQLPDLSRHVVLLPQPYGAARMRALLLRAMSSRQYSAILPPFVGTLKQWLETRTNTTPLLGERQREAILLAALRSHPYLQARPIRWPFIDSLLQLFDELNLANPATITDEETLRTTLERGYGAGRLEALSREARLVHELWRAWQEHLQETGVKDATAGLQHALHEVVRNPEPDRQVYLVGPIDLADQETMLLARLCQQGRLTVVFHGQVGCTGHHPDAPLSALTEKFGASIPAVTAKAPYSEALNAVFLRDGQDLRTRALALSARFPDSPLADRLEIYQAANAEEEAHAIELQVRRWLLDGHKNIGVVTHDRKLARRLRALFERAGVELKDAGGWPLSTTSAATVVVRWLETVEQGFAPALLLDLLQSPFVLPTLDPITKKELLSRLRRDVLEPHGMAGTTTLERYQQALQRKDAMDDYGDGTRVAVSDIVARVQRASTRLRALKAGGSQPAFAYLDALRESLNELGVTSRYYEDEAGLLVEAQIEELTAIARGHKLHMHWDEFRDWMSHTLERCLFTPQAEVSGVQLIGFAQSRLQFFDALIIAGCAESQLPGSRRATPFFNERVRRELGLATVQEERVRLFYDFRRLLESAEKTLITYRSEDDGEPVLASPWVELVQGFHLLAYGDPLVPRILSSLVARPETTIAARDEVLPAPSPSPAVAVPGSLTPSRVSASSHQRLLDCPYQYFASDCLRLRETADVETELTKVDYGQRVHTILHAFHAGISGLPGPWQGALSAERRAEAEQLLAAVSRSVFAFDLERNFFARGWLSRWLDLIPGYVDWQIQREGKWHFKAAEADYRCSIPEAGLELYGRLDRLDANGDTYSVVDYKTGALPKLEEILAGESVQLPLYATLLSQAGRVEEVLLLGLSDRVTDKVRLEGEPLAALSQQTLTRMIDSTTAIREGVPLSAWGEDTVCDYCQMEGLCRKEMWRLN